MLLLIPVGGINEGGTPVQGARWTYGTSVYELLMYTPNEAEVPPEIKDSKGKFLILERSIKGIPVMRCKVGVYDFNHAAPMTVFYDYNTVFLDTIKQYINATHVHGVPTLEWCMNMGMTFTTDFQNDNYSDWEFQQM